MRTSLLDSHRELFYVLFWLFEALLIASALLLLLIDPRRGLPVSDAAGLTFWFAFAGLFTISFLFRRVARRLAIIGWWTLFIGFWSPMALPIV
jgi:hypothetical protein